MPKKARILLVGGGSGGHIMPNLAVASAIKTQAPASKLLYIASRSPLDASLLKPTGIPFKQIFSGKWRRYFSWQNFIDPFFILIAFFQSLFILMRFKPQVIFSKGGYVSLPVTWAAFLLRIPIILHESDSRMGLANRMAAKLAQKVCVAFPSLQKDKKTQLTGNPVRAEILDGDPKKGYEITGFNTQKPVLLVWGGSQGAQQINDLLLSDFEKFTQHFQVIHITGKGKGMVGRDRHAKGKGKEAHRSPLTAHRYKAFDYVGEDLKHLYAITTLIIGRAGANSLAEIALLQTPNILIPLGNSDQRKNAEYFKSKHAGLVWEPGQNLFDLTLDLWQNEAQKNKMKAALADLATPHAAEDIARLILEIKK